MKYIFISLISEIPTGFENRSLSKRELLGNHVALLADSLDAALDIMKGFSERVSGIIFTPGHQFSFQQLYSNLWHVEILKGHLINLYQIAEVFLNLISYGFNALSNQNRIQIELERNKKTLGQIQESYKDNTIRLRRKINEFRQVFEHSRVGMFRTDLSGNLILANPAILRIMKQQSIEDINKIGLGHLYRNPQERIRLIELTKKGPVKAFETQLLDSEGKNIDVILNTYPVYDEDGEMEFLEGNLIDVTDIKRVENQLIENEANLRITLDSIADAVIATDIDGNITQMNPVAELLTGWTISETSGKHLSEIYNIINANTREKIEQPLNAIIESGEKTSFSDEIILISSKGNNEYYISESSAPIQDIQGKISGYVLVFRDITEKRKLEQERIKMENLEMIGVLAGGIAHDFNNLLTGVFGNIEMAKYFLEEDHNSANFLKYALDSVEQAKYLTNQLLTFAKGGDPIKETLNLTGLIIETANFAIRGSNAKITYKISPEIWHVNADKGQISQVITNLVINAQQAMPMGGNITITATNIEDNESKFVQISIEDEGVGIAPQFINKIFDPYFTTKQKGSGLGLAVTYSIIKKHKGQISVESQLNEGSKFTFILPAEVVTSDIAIKIPDCDEETTDSISANILVLEDEIEVRRILGTMLEQLGYSCDFAIEGKVAIEKYKESIDCDQPYDLMIADLTIPGGMGGKDASKHILSLNPNAKIIVSSGYATDPVMGNFEQYGFKGVIAKPFTMETLNEVIQQVLRENEKM